MRKQTVYLAGGFKSDWAKRVQEECGQYAFFDWNDPKAKEHPNGERIVMTVNQYGKLDLHLIKQSDIVFAYVERTNPSCIGLSCEVGYAKGLGKTVIVVLERNHETIKDNHLQFITQVADITFDTLEDGIEYLNFFK